MSSLQRTGYEHIRPTHQCAQTGTRFQPGEVFVAVLIENPDPSQGDDLVRVDYSLEAWETGARPEQSPVAVWRAVERDPDSRPSLIPDTEELTALFESLDPESEGRAAVFRYLVALMLMRKRVLRLADQRQGPDGRPILILARRPASKGAEPERCEVSDPGMDEDAIAAGIEELGAVLADGDHSGQPS